MGTSLETRLLRREYHWAVLVRSRAIDADSYVMACNDLNTAYMSWYVHYQRLGRADQQDVCAWWLTTSCSIDTPYLGGTRSSYIDGTRSAYRCDCERYMQL